MGMNVWQISPERAVIFDRNLAEIDARGCQGDRKVSHTQSQPVFDQLIPVGGIALGLKPVI